MKEKDIIKKILLEYSKAGHRLWRNNVGTGWQGICHWEGRHLSIQGPRPLHAGLCQGSSDIIGFTRVKITQEMVGETVAIFTALEVKTKNTPATWLQKNFIKTILKNGGIGAIVYSFKNILKWEKENDRKI